MSVRGNKPSRTPRLSPLGARRIHRFCQTKEAAVVSSTIAGITTSAPSRFVGALESCQSCDVRRTESCAVPSKSSTKAWSSVLGFGIDKATSPSAESDDAPSKFRPGIFSKKRSNQPSDISYRPLKPLRSAAPGSVPRIGRVTTERSDWYSPKKSIPPPLPNALLVRSPTT